MHQPQGNCPAWIKFPYNLSGLHCSATNTSNTGGVRTPSANDFLVFQSDYFFGKSFLNPTFLFRRTKHETIES